MYIPKHFVQSDPAVLLDVMRRHDFATLISTIDGAPFAAHVPLLVSMADGVTTIAGHVARANPHWQAMLSDPAALVIFHGPHTYVSPTLYEDANMVPTWNYIAVHARGNVVIDHSDAGKLAILSALIAHNEPGYQAQFDQMDNERRTAMLGAIVGFTMRVDQLEGKFKLGQHRLTGEKPAMQGTHETGGENQQAIAGWMKRLGYWPA
ncbi:transcriptional regulator [Actimicrobium sp. GrIS 1.19]|uniref:FMN-binding negative transcriptional regulator n=1 Tax=Actimicrobium sp. GrIS 1.19 TaxID=3071708 RepID=UPI002DFFE5EA|nr:transcriptional regulator [Actimicrobium sp. GrIS 1.19]